MVATLEEQILDNIKTSLQSISIVNGFNTDVARVYRAETDNTEDLADLPGVVMIHDGSERDDSRLGLIVVTLRVVLYPVVKVSDPSNWNESIQLFVADVERRLREDVTRGGNAFDTHVTTAEVPMVDSEAEKAAARIEANIIFRHAYADPTSSL